MVNQNWHGRVLGSAHLGTQAPTWPKDHRRVDASKIHTLPLPFLHRILRLTALMPREIESQMSGEKNRFP